MSMSHRDAWRSYWRANRRWRRASSYRWVLWPDKTWEEMKPTAPEQRAIDALRDVRDARWERLRRVNDELMADAKARRLLERLARGCS